jgi:hypothetical protein
MAVAGVTVIDVSTGAEVVTVTFAVLLLPLAEAVTV